MAGFLRKKTKQPEPTTKEFPSVSLSSSGPPTPLFSRFSSNAQNSSNVAPRIVSSPMSLASHGRKDPTPKGGPGRGNSNLGASSLAAGSREAEMARRRRVQDQAQASQASLNHRPIVDKPLPFPVGNGDRSPPMPTAAPVANRRTISNRGPGPPPTFHTQQHQAMWSRASLDSRDRENKPLPRPASAQGYSSPERQPSLPPSGYNFTPAVPPKRKVSVSSVNTAVTPQIGPPITNAYRKLQPPLPPSSAQSPDENFASQGPLPQASKRAQNFPLNAPNGVGGGQSNRRVSQTVPEIFSTPMSVRALDLPPEFALFQVCKLKLLQISFFHSDARNTHYSNRAMLRVTEGKG